MNLPNAHMDIFTTKHRGLKQNATFSVEHTVYLALFLPANINVHPPAHIKPEAEN